MLGKPQWFRRRKYGGWGLVPATWQGWAYIGALIVPFLLLKAFAPLLDAQIVIIVSAVWTFLLVLEITRLMAGLMLDERERLHEALAERNALWVILSVVIGGYLYRLAASADPSAMQVDPLIIGALVAGLAAKAATNLYLERRR